MRTLILFGSAAACRTNYIHMILYLINLTHMPTCLLASTHVRLQFADRATLLLSFTRISRLCRSPSLNANRTTLQVYNIKFICSLITIRSGTSNREPVCRLEMQTPQPAHAGTIFPITHWQSTVLNMAARSVYNDTYSFFTRMGSLIPNLATDRLSPQMS